MLKYYLDYNGLRPHFVMTSNEKNIGKQLQIGFACQFVTNNFFKTNWM